MPTLSPSLLPSPCCQLPLLPDLVSHGLNTFLPHRVVSVAAWAVLVLGMAPLLLPGLQTHASVSPPLFPARLGSSAWMWEDVAWWWWLVPVPWPHPGAHDQHGIGVAEPRHGSGAGKPSPCPPWDVWLCHPLPCGAFPVPGVSQTLARPSLLNGAGTGGHEPGQPPARSACWHVPSIGQSRP